MARTTEEEILLVKESVIYQAKKQINHHIERVAHYKALLYYAENTLDKSLLQVLLEGVK